ncbi:MAG: hypothetical protein WBC88_10740 [Candidatus Zixiibacteriota bacterium]
MKRAVKVVLFLFLVCLVGGFINQVQAEGPKLLIPQTMFDFGYVPPQSKISHYYLVKNVGEDILKIEKVKPG